MSGECPRLGLEEGRTPELDFTAHDDKSPVSMRVKCFPGTIPNEKIAMLGTLVASSQTSCSETLHRLFSREIRRLTAETGMFETVAKLGKRTTLGLL